jgi:hypothetical protein
VTGTVGFSRRVESCLPTSLIALQRHLLLTALRRTKADIAL